MIMNINKKTIGIGIVISLGIAFGLSKEWMEFFRYFVLSGICLSGVLYWLSSRKKTDERVAELESLLGKKQTDERVEILENMLKESDDVIGEQESVLKHYEELLEEATVRFPCNCGKNVFEGIFKPGEVVEVECESCNSKYAVQLKLDSVLIAEPIEDLNIDKLIKDNVEV